MVKLILKRILLLMGIAAGLPFIILTIAEGIVFRGKSERILGWCKEIYSIIPTFIGEYMRLGYYWAVCKSISPDCLIMFGSMIAHRDTTIKAGVVIGCYSLIGYSDIGENVLMGARVSIISGKYQHGKPQERASGAELREQYDKIKIGKNCWIGQETVIMAGIGDNCTIGAGSVVYKEVPANSTFMGNPARKVNVDLTQTPKEP